MHSLHHPLFARLGTLKRRSAIGAFRHLTAEFSVPIPESANELRWRADLDGGALMDLGVYQLAWCRRMAGDIFTVTEAHAVMRWSVDAQVEAKLLFAGGIAAVVRSSIVVDMPFARLFIEGEACSIEVENPLAPERGQVLRLKADGRTTAEVVPRPTTYEAQLSALRATLIDGAPVPFPPDDYVRSMEAIAAVRTKL